MIAKSRSDPPGQIDSEHHMTTQHRPIPVLPDRPRVKPAADHIHRSYPVGRQSFLRACEGEVLILCISTPDPLPSNLQASLVTTLNFGTGRSWTRIPFAKVDDRRLTCRVTPDQTGLHSFRAEFSLDRGTTWLRDTVPDAWVLVDPPQVDGLVVYTLIPTVSGTVDDWKKDLGRISSMGFNAIHLLPLTTLDASESPYSAKDLFDIDPSYLVEGSRKDGLSQLEDFIAEARKLKIRLIFDLVLNHVGVTSTIARQAPDWIVPDEAQPDGLQRARYWCDQGWNVWQDIVLINYEHPSEGIRSEIRAYMTEYALFWAKYANDTGGFVRFDNLHSSDPAFVTSLTAALHSNYPEVGILAEYFADEGTLLRTGPQWGLNLHLATPWDYKFVPQLRDYLKYIHRVSEHIRYFMPITSHDAGSPAQEFGTAESTVARYVAAALLGTGATGCPQGVEYGEAERIKFIGRQPKRVFPAEARFAPFITRINAIVAEYSAFRCGNNCHFVDNNHAAIIAAFRRDSGTQAAGFLVVCNFDIHNAERIVVDLGPLLNKSGPFACHELISGETLVLPHPHFEILVPACGAQVLKFPVETPQ
jgi:hypothetical protein